MLAGGTESLVRIYRGRYGCTLNGWLQSQLEMPNAIIGYKTATEAGVCREAVKNSSLKLVLSALVLLAPAP
jgi:hypothetical protein